VSRIVRVVEVVTLVAGEDELERGPRRVARVHVELVDAAAGGPRRICVESVALSAFQTQAPLSGVAADRRLEALRDGMRRDRRPGRAHEAVDVVLHDVLVLETPEVLGLPPLAAREVPRGAVDHLERGRAEALEALVTGESRCGCSRPAADWGNVTPSSWFIRTLKLDAACPR
jgi:hypothetical protein